MNRKFRPARLAVVIVVFVALLAVYTVSLYKMQIYDPARAVAEASDMPSAEIEYTEVIKAARGEILDRNGEKLVSSRSAYNISISRKALNASGTPNEIISELIELAGSYGITHNDTFPVTQGAPYEYVYDMTSAQRSRLDTYFDYFRLDPEMSASDFIVWLKQHYDIPYTVGVAEARMIIGVRYELEIRVLVNIAPYVFAEDIPLELVSVISERAYPGVSVSIGSERIYHTTAAAHLLGYIRSITDSQMEYYTSLGYPMDALVGQSGVESAFEEYLHGVDGSRSVSTTAEGAVLAEEIIEPQPGYNVYLTIDKDLQIAAEEGLEDVIDSINAEREEGQMASGGAVVAIEVSSGETLAMASYPTYDLATLFEGGNYTSVANDASSPLLNRATQGLYNPGSTFKPVTALAALRAGTITRWTTITDQGQYMKYDDYRPRCWLYTATGATHGSLDLVGALAHSCNYYFYQVGDSTGPSRIAEAAYDFGFGAKTGIEIYEEEGIVASEETKKAIKNENWWNADTLITAIGQGLNEFTPVQLANYAATIASGGTIHRVTLLNEVKTNDYTGTIYEHEPEVRSELEGDDALFIGYLQDGMRAVVTYGTARDAFSGYQVPVAAKTGTVQTGSTYNDGVFICYAPADDPQIAVAVVVEKGGSGAAIMEVAKLVMDEYFKTRSVASVTGDGELIP